AAGQGVRRANDARCAARGQGSTGCGRDPTCWVQTTLDALRADKARRNAGGTRTRPTCWVQTTLDALRADELEAVRRACATRFDVRRRGLPKRAAQCGREAQRLHACGEATAPQGTGELDAVRRACGRASMRRAQRLCGPCSTSARARAIPVGTRMCGDHS